MFDFLAIFAHVFMSAAVYADAIYKAQAEAKPHRVLTARGRMKVRNKLGRQNSQKARTVIRTNDREHCLMMADLAVAKYHEILIANLAVGGTLWDQLLDAECADPRQWSNSRTEQATRPIVGFILTDTDSVVCPTHTGPISDADLDADKVRPVFVGDADADAVHECAGCAAERS